MQYFTALDAGDVRTLETAWPGDVVIYDPRAGEVRGHKELRRFVKRNQSRLAGLKTRSEPVASTTVGSRAVVELLAHLTVDGQPMSWPVAVVVESPTTARSCSAPTAANCPRSGAGGSGRRFSLLVLSGLGMSSAAIKPHSKPATPTPSWTPSSPEATCASPWPPCRAPRDRRAPRVLRRACRRRGHRPRTLREHRRRRALRAEYNCVRWGNHPVTPQAGMAVYELGPDGLLAAARFYDDVEAPA